tara:strand:+ start:850 stop:1254 length:405 start_codon:yes stop_codon:yes gene_type:complete
MIKIYQGGATGLEQQKAKRYPEKRKPSEYKYPSIKEAVKKNHDIELVFMGGGFGYHCVEEDAEYMKNHYSSKVHDRGGTAPYNMCTFPYGDIKNKVSDFERDKVKYAILRVVDSKKGIREIVESSDKRLIGLKF